MSVRRPASCANWPRFSLRHWEVLFEAAIGDLDGVPFHVDAMLLHPQRGVALIDIAPKVTPRASELMRQTLAETDALAAWASWLPIVYCCISPDEVPELAGLLDTAFAGHMPVPVGDSDWVRELRGLDGAGRKSSRNLRVWYAAPAAGVVAGLILSGASPIVILSQLLPTLQASVQLRPVVTEASAALPRVVEGTATEPNIAPPVAPPIPATPHSDPAAAVLTPPEAVPMQQAHSASPPSPDDRPASRRRSPDKVLTPISADRSAPPWQPADARCTPLLARLQLGETPTPDARHILQTACAPRP